jgi:pimeloyl-ACP methyl ester carboxylesterase
MEPGASALLRKHAIIRRSGERRPRRPEPDAFPAPHTEKRIVLPELQSYQSTCDVSAGRICYYDRGQGSPIVLIHGMFGDFLDWEPVLEPLANSHRVIAIDLPGFGNSSKPRVEYSAEFFVANLHEFFQQLELREPVLAGNSFGGQVAMLYALQHPETVSKLILVNSGGFRKHTPEEIASVESRFTEPILSALTPQINALLFSNVFTRPSPTSLRYLERQNQRLARSDYPAYAYAISRSISLSLSAYLIDRLAEIRCPTLLVWGENDQVLPLEQAQQALRHLIAGQLVVLPGCGHAPQLECPREFVENVLPFLAQSR